MPQCRRGSQRRRPARDVLGWHDGHCPRHSKRYRDFRAEHARLQRERVAAFGEFRADVASRAYPEDGHGLTIAPEELKAFRGRAAKLKR